MSLLQFAKSKLWRTPSMFHEQEKTQENKDNPMFDKLFAALKAEHGLPHMTSLLNAINQVAAHFNEEYVKDHDVRNAALDALKDIFEGLKKPA